MDSQLDTDSLVEVRRWLQAVDGLTVAVNSTRSLRAILDLVAGSGRTLLGFDFCALLLPDLEQKNLVITGWSGLSADYVARVNADRPVRLTANDAEQAPSSKAFKSGRPVAIPNIADEPEFTPWGGVAREQGYQAMISVPLIAGGVVAGTLNGYHAAVHHFTEHEIERLTLLANHAAIALTSARMVEEMELLNESLRRQRDRLTKSEQIHQQFLAVALRGGGMAGIAHVLADLLARPVLIEDPRGIVLAQINGPEELLEQQLRRATVVSEDLAPQFVPGRGQQGYLVWTVRLAGDAVARVWLPGNNNDLSPIDKRAVEHASIVISLEVLRLRTALEVEHRLRGELLADILSGTPIDSRPLRERAERLGHDLSLPHFAMVGSVTTSDPQQQASGYERALNAASGVAADRKPRPLMAMHRGFLVGLWPIPPERGMSDGRADTVGTAERVRRAMAAVPGVVSATVALSGNTFQSYPQAYRTARGALDVAVRSGRSNSTVPVTDLGVSGLLLQLDDPEQLVEFANRTLRKVLEHDQSRGTQLIATLRTYLDQGQSRSAVASALHVHPNTVTQRLQRIETLTGLELSEPAAILQARAALMLLDVAGVA